MSPDEESVSEAPGAQPPVQARMKAQKRALDSRVRTRAAYVVTAHIAFGVNRADRGYVRTAVEVRVVCLRARYCALSGTRPPSQLPHGSRRIRGLRGQDMPGQRARPVRLGVHRPSSPEPAGSELHGSNPIKTREKRSGRRPPSPGCGGGTGSSARRSVAAP
jgi:hypothetical protein